jgi:hypothetical protein
MKALHAILATILLLAAQAAHAQALSTDDMKGLAAIFVYSKQCGPIGPLTERTIGLLGGVHADKAAAENGMMDVVRNFQTQGKQFWCANLRPAMEK